MSSEQLNALKESYVAPVVQQIDLLNESPLCISPLHTNSNTTQDYSSSSVWNEGSAIE